MGAGTVELNEANFEDTIAKSDVPVLVDFWAEWCRPCKMLGPIVEDIAQDFQGRLVVAKVDIDANPDLAVKHNVGSIPTLIVFKGGRVADRAVGAYPKEQLVQFLSPHV